MQVPGGALSSEVIRWLLGSLSSLYCIPFDPKLVEQEFPPPHDLNTFYEAARVLDFKTSTGPHPTDWQTLPLPSIAFLRAIPETVADEDVPSIPVLILTTGAAKQAPLVDRIRNLRVR